MARAGLLALLFAPVSQGAIDLESQQAEAAEGKPAPPFGKAVRDAYFQFEKGFINFNHGGFGATPRPVRKAMEAFTDAMEAKPTQWFGGGPDGYQKVLAKVRPALARLVGANESDLVFLENASSGLNAVLRSLGWSRGDILLLTDAAYAALRNAAEWLVKRYGIRLVVVSFSYPVAGPESYLEPVGRALASLSASELARVRLAAFDHISSYPAVILPVAELAALVKHRTAGHALVLLDGAHALGQVAVDVGGELAPAGVDFWVGDGHKWLMSPHGSALLWAAPSAQASLEPVTISSENGPDTSFQGRFDYIGTRDYTPWCAMGAALDFRAGALGGETQLRGYIHDLAIWAGRTLAEQFQTEVLAPASMTGAITNVRLPIPTSWPEEDQRRCASLISEELLRRHNFQVVTTTLNATARGSATPAPTFWVRLSAQVYLERADFRALARHTLAIAAGCQAQKASPEVQV